MEQSFLMIQIKLWSIIFKCFKKVETLMGNLKGLSLLNKIYPSKESLVMIQVWFSRIWVADLLGKGGFKLLLILIVRMNARCQPMKEIYQMTRIVLRDWILAMSTNLMKTLKDQRLMKPAKKIKPRTNLSIVNLINLNFILIQLMLNHRWLCFLIMDKFIWKKILFRFNLLWKIVKSKF